MIYFTFFHSLFWQNTMKKGGRDYRFYSSVGQNVQSRRRATPHMCQSRRNELRSPAFPPAIHLYGEENGAGHTKGGHRHDSRPRQGPRRGAPHGNPSLPGAALLAASALTGACTRSLSGARGSGRWLLLESGGRKADQSLTSTKPGGQRSSCCSLCFLLRCAPCSRVSTSDSTSFCWP